MIPPIAATVAGDEPEIAPKNRHATMVTVARPPVLLPTSLLATSTSLLAMPPFSMIPPARIKQGIARSGKDSRPEYIDCATNFNVVIGKNCIVVSIPSPRDIPIGVPIRISIIATENNISASTYISLLKFLS
ncbi:hypothetical protein SDC9_165194 [bioreactor metagenome]|uniref:Uncharacterized protein n=1 Tax=bioreactor metagenome TaxID=1076179 RepID=A0A645FW93_9ZZZZ